MSGWRHALSWFPGHVARATKEMAERLSHVDLVLEVRDARAPRSTSSSQISSMLSLAERTSRRIIVINKADLVTERQRERIADWIEEDEPHVPVFFTVATDPSQRARSVRALLSTCLDKVREQSPRLFSPAIDPAAGAQSRAARAISAQAAAAAGQQMWTHDVHSLPLIMMVVGVPNVGKSSLINAARRIAADDAEHAERWVAQRNLSEGGSGTLVTAPGRQRPGRARSRTPAKIGKLPGVTTSLNGFQVSWQPALWCLDTPGVLAPRVDGGWEAALRLAVLDLLKYEHAAVEGVAAYLLHHLATCDPTILERWPHADALVERGAASVVDLTRDRRDLLGVGPDPLASPDALDDDSGACMRERFALMLLEAVAHDMKFYGRKPANGEPAEPDTSRAASKLLSMLRKGELGPACLDARPPTLERDRRHERGLPWIPPKVDPITGGLASALEQRRMDRKAKRLGRTPRRIV